MTRNRQLASWLVAQRAAIERSLAAKLGPAAPRSSSTESEVLRRFRSFASAALQRGHAAQPALDGLRPDARRVGALLEAWCEAAIELAGDAGPELKGALTPLLTRFRSALRTTGDSRRARGAPGTRQRAVRAAIDRVADAFLAVDAQDGRVVDANPAAGALLGLARDALLGVDALDFVPEPARNAFWVELDAVSEASEPRRFRAALRDVQGAAIPVECTVTRFSTRERTLALLLARPEA